MTLDDALSFATIELIDCELEYRGKVYKIFHETIPGHTAPSWFILTPDGIKYGPLDKRDDAIAYVGRGLPDDQ